MSDLYKQGIQLFKKGEYEQASELFVSLLESDGRHHKAWNALGVCLTRLEDFEQAQTCFENAVKLCPDNQIYKKNLESVKGKREEPPAIPIQFRKLKDIIRLLSKIKTDSADYACFVIGSLLLGIFFIAPMIDIVIKSPANEIIGLSAVIFYCFFLFSIIIRNLIYLGLRLRHILYGIISFGCISLIVLNAMQIVNFSGEGNQPNINQENKTKENITPTITPISTQDTPATHTPVPQPTKKECPPLQASFTSTVTDYDPYQISFTDTSEPLTSHERTRRWDFGDGSSSTEEKPVHTYSGPPKTYSVTLTVWNACNQSNTTTMYVDPGCQELALNMVAYPQIGNLPLKVSFNDTTSLIEDGYSWKWAFGDGQILETTDKTQRNISHTYNKPGIYYPSLTVFNRCGQNQSDTKSITVQVKGYISGRLWLDENVNETIDVGERNLSGWQIYLERWEDGEWKQMQSTSTNFEGKYHFSILDTGGVYRIREELKPGYWITTGDSGLSHISESFSFFEPDMQYTKNFGHKRYDIEKFHDITLTSSRNATISEGSYMQWVQRGISGYAQLNGTRYELRNEDRCAIHFYEKSRRAQISLAGGIHATNLMNVSLSINGIEKDKGVCNELVSPMIERYESDLNVIIEPEKYSFCTMIWDGNNTPAHEKKELIIYDIIPLPVKRLDIDLNQNRVYIYGRANSFEQK